MRRPTNPERAHWPAVAAEAVALALLLVAAVVLAHGGWLFRLGPFRLSIRSAWRPLALALGVVAGRCWLQPRRPALPRLVARLVGPLADDELRLFGPRVGRPWTRSLGHAAVLVLGYTLLVVALTWPQARSLYSVPDLGDPLFSIWRIGWVNHQLPRHPLALFDANIFYPERLTFTYSDSMIVPALMIAPALWLGVHPVVAYNILFLSGFVLSGVATFLLARALTGRIDAAVVAGAIFAVYPYRYEHYSHLELQMTMWMPLALWGLHRTLALGRLRDGLLTGLAFTLQALSSLYYGLFLSTYMVVLGLVLWLGRGRPWRPLFALAAGALVAGVLVAPVASQYLANRALVGDRGIIAVQFYSAEPPDYTTSHRRSRIYSGWSAEGWPERRLFPGFTPLVLSAVALWPPLSVARIGYTLALVFAVDGSLGLNGYVYPWLHAYVPGFRGLRVPARFAILVGLSLAILAGYGAARLIARFPRWRTVLVGAMLGSIVFEALPRIELKPVWPEPPPIYARLAGQATVVLAENPMPENENADLWFDARYMYFSVWHWNKLVNGNSGFLPPSYDELLRREADFPSDRAIEYLKQRGVDYLTVHGALMSSPERYAETIAALDRRSDVELVTAARWEGSESRLYRLRRGF